MTIYSEFEDENAFTGLTLICPEDSIQRIVRPQILRINYFSPPASFHPHHIFDIGSQTICKSLFEGLLRVSEKGEVQLAAAESLAMASSGDDMTITLTLRPGLWSNGKEITASDYVKSWKKIISSKNYHAKRFFFIENAEKFYHGRVSLRKLGLRTLGDRKIIIQLKHSFSQFLQALADPIFSPLYGSNLQKEPTVFNGPFIVKYYDPKKELVLSKNPMYWDKRSVKLETIHISFIKDQNQVVSLYENDKLDWLGTPFNNDVFYKKTLTHVKSEQVSAPFWLFCNVKNPKLNQKIRCALSYGLNRLDMIQKISPDHKVMRTILPEELSALPLGNLIETDRERALELFEEGLKELGLDRKDFELTLNHSHILEQEQLAFSLKEQWEDLFQIKITLIKDDWNTFHKKIKSKEYELGGFYLYNTYNDPSYFMEFFEKAYHNHSGWEHAGYKRYVRLAKMTVGDEREHYFRKAERILMEQMPVIPIYNHTHFYVAKEKLKNFSAPKFNYIDFKWVYFEE